MSQANQLHQKGLAFSWCFPVISAVGVTSLCLGITTLFTMQKDSVVSALPHLATRSIDWFFFSAGISLLFVSSVILGVTVYHSRTTRSAWHEVGELVTVTRNQEPRMLKPSTTKILAISLYYVLFGIGVPTFAIATFLLKPSVSMVFIVCFFLLIGFVCTMNAVDSLSCRVEISDDEIFLWSLFRAKAFHAVEIRSAKYSRYRGTTSLTIYGDRSWFVVSSDSFDAGQLDVISKFCDRAANLYPD